MTVGKNMLTRFIGVVVFIALLVSPCYAFPMPEARALDNTINQSDEIALYKVTGIEPEKSAVPEPNAIYIDKGKRHWYYAGAIFLELVDQIQPPSRYLLHLSCGVKGNAELTEITLPQLQCTSYGGDRTPPKIGDSILLLLHKDPLSGAVAPTDPLLPFIRLPQNLAVDPTSFVRGDVHATVINLIIAALSDPDLRLASTYLLRNQRGAAIVVGLAPYVQDANIEIRANVLNAMLINQQVSCIPREAALEQIIEQRGNGTSTNSIGAFDSLTTADAVEYLNPLLWSPYKLLKQKSFQTVARIPLSSSIPYLLIAALDPSSETAEEASAMIRGIVPALSQTPDSMPTASQHDQDFNQILAWWQAELNGKHSPRLWPTPLEAHSEAGSVGDIEKQVWVGDGTHRETSLRLLDPVATKESVPYLMVALFDPEKRVSYSAYTTLHRLLNVKSPLVSEVSFVGGKNVDTAPIFDWWREEQLGDHLPPSQHTSNNVILPPDIVQEMKEKSEAKDAAFP